MRRFGLKGGQIATKMGAREFSRVLVYGKGVCEILIAFIRTVIIYVVVVGALRFLDKRQIGELQASELAVAVLISEFAVLPISSTNVPLTAALVPIATLVILEVIISFVAMKSIPLRKVLLGKASVLIQNGQVNIEEMESLRLNIDDLLEDLRINNIFDIADVETAILERGGKLSVIPKSEKRNLTPADVQIKPKQEQLPITLIQDGVVNEKALKQHNKTHEWLVGKLNENNIKDVETVYLASVSSDGTLFVQMKSD